MADAVNPDYYENGPFECILLAEQYSFNVGNMIKYVWRHKGKGASQGGLAEGPMVRTESESQRRERRRIPLARRQLSNRLHPLPLRLGDSDSPESQCDYRRGT